MSSGLKFKVQRTRGGESDEDLLNYDRRREEELAPAVDPALAAPYYVRSPALEKALEAPQTPRPRGEAPAEAQRPPAPRQSPQAPSYDPSAEYDARDQARRSKLIAGVGQAGETLMRGATGFKGDGSFFQEMGNDADRTLSLDLSRLRQAAPKPAKAADAHLAELRDPASYESQRLREIFRASHPMANDLYNRMGANAFNEIAGAELPSVKDSLRSTADVDRAVAKGAALDPKSTVSQDAQDAAIAVLRSTGVRMDALTETKIRESSAADVEKKWIPLLTAEQKRQWQNLRDDDKALVQKERDAHRAERAAKFEGLKRDKATAAAESKLSATQRAYYAGPDYELDASVSEPTKPEASQFRSAVAQTDALRSGIRELKAMHEKYGTEILPTEAKARMGAIARDLQLQAKGKSVYELGVLAGPDLALLEQLIPNPAGGNSNALSFIGGDQTLAQLDQLEKQLAIRIDTRARSLGYRRKGQGDTSQPAPANNAQPQTRRKSINGRTFEQAADGSWDEV